MSSAALVLLGVPLAGALGALVRFEVTARAARRYPAGRALGTAAVNLLGAFLLALLVGLADAGRVSADMMLVAGLGFAGSLTTFSTWVVEAVRAALDGDRHPALVGGLELLGQLALGVLVAAAVLGL